MAQVPKIDSNIVGLAFAEERELGILPGEQGLSGQPVWNRLEPNSYSDFGGEIVTVAPNPINDSRQRRKGQTTDLNAAGGFNHNLTFQNMQELMQGVMFADVRRKGRVTPSAVLADRYSTAVASNFMVNMLVKGSGFAQPANNKMGIVTAVSAAAVEVAGLAIEPNPPAQAVLDVVGFQGGAAVFKIAVQDGQVRLTSTSIDFRALGLVPGQWIFIGGDTDATRFSNAANNGFKRIRSVAENVLVLDKSFQEMVTDAGAGKTVRLFFGDVLRNETGPMIKRRSYSIERTLGAPDSAAPSQIQSEVLKGAIPNEFTLNIPSAELINFDLSFLAIDNELRSSTEGPKQTNVRSGLSAKEYNSSTDIGRIRLSVVREGELAPQALFAFVTEASIAINNNISANKAVGVLGAFDMTAGTFAVSGEINAYFSTIQAVQAVRQNSDVTLDISFVKDNTGLIYDLPLIALGDGRLNVELDNPITIPLGTEAASGEDIDPNLNHTLLLTMFHYLPNAAM